MSGRAMLIASSIIVALVVISLLLPDNEVVLVQYVTLSEGEVKLDVDFGVTQVTQPDPRPWVGHPRAWRLAVPAALFGGWWIWKRRPKDD